MNLSSSVATSLPRSRTRTGSSVGCFLLPDARKTLGPRVRSTVPISLRIAAFRVRSTFLFAWCDGAIHGPVNLYADIGRLNDALEGRMGWYPSGLAVQSCVNAAYLRSTVSKPSICELPKTCRKYGPSWESMDRSPGCESEPYSVASLRFLLCF
jgi:hypothetical protein